MSEHFTTQEFYAYLDGELSKGDVERIQSHLDGCAHCRRQLLQAERLFSRIEGLRELTLERDFAPIVVREIEAQQAARRSLPWWIAAEALAAFAVLAGWLIGRPPLSPAFSQTMDALDLFLLWNQWAWPQRVDLLRWITSLPDQLVEFLSQVDPSRLWEPELALPWAAIIAGLIVLWLLSNSLLLADQYYRLHPFDRAQRRKGSNHG